jgi:hypothetical protein
VKRCAKWTLVPLLRRLISLRVLPLLRHEDRRQLEYTSGEAAAAVIPGSAGPYFSRLRHVAIRRRCAVA